MGWSDEALMGNLRRGDMQAFDELYTRHRQPLFNFILRLLQDAALAEDVFQETYMRVLENADRFNPRGQIFNLSLYHSPQPVHGRAAPPKHEHPNRANGRAVS